MTESNSQNRDIKNGAKIYILLKIVFLELNYEPMRDVDVQTIVDIWLQSMQWKDCSV